eukprot:TRINITY_DN38421_c0_g1_i1.p1 TRINITY_DN38421_c0_g1~~TRINITY_DN38421_c0_g1_i1.p1  ORF type:complete len:557 (-),score=106.37 TRINITY_DN38421_c0_g1_i1:207-1877(-)
MGQRSSTAGYNDNEAQGQPPLASGIAEPDVAAFQEDDAASSAASAREALDMLKQLLGTYIGKRSKSDLLSVVADPSLPLRLYPVHKKRYDDHLEGFEEVDVKFAAGKHQELSENGAGSPMMMGRMKTLDDGFSRRSVTKEGFLAYAALAAVFSRAAYGSLMKRGAGDRARYFIGGAAKSAMGSFDGQSHVDAFVELAGAHHGDIVMSDWNERTFEPAFVLFWAHSLRWLVLVVRGSSEGSSILTDVAAVECPLAGGQAHAGMVKSARSILRRAGPSIAEALRDVPEYSLVCTGHSLGGDVAAIVAILLREGDEGVPSFRPPPDEDDGTVSGEATSLASSMEDCPPSMRLPVAYAFGASPITSFDVAEKASRYILCVSRDVDYITRLSAFGLDRLMFELTENSAPKLAKKWLVGALWPAEDQTVSNAKMRVYGESAQVAPLLVAPGRLLHVDSRGVGKRPDPTPRLFWPLPGFYHEVYISPHMFHDHLPIRYVEDLLGALRSGVPGAAEEFHLQDRAAQPEAQEDLRRAIEELIKTRQRRGMARQRSEPQEPSQEPG